MDVKIDWLAFTVPFHDNPYRTIMTSWDFMFRKVCEYTNAKSSFDGIKAGFDLKPARGFYQYRAYNESCGISISWGDVNEHVFVEFSGIGCEWLRSTGEMDSLLPMVSARCSRIDFATDIETNVTPKEFVAASSTKRIKTRSSVTSPTGDTEYLGSRTGERMARVYRYHPPHPRSGNLRIEIELKGDAAKQACGALNRENLINISKSVNAPFGWEHYIWTLNDMIASPLPSTRSEREDANTLRWLTNVVAPALKKMADKGHFNLHEWCETHLFS